LNNERFKENQSLIHPWSQKVLLIIDLLVQEELSDFLSISYSSSQASKRRFLDEHFNAHAVDMVTLIIYVFFFVLFFCPTD